jgi:urease alpha subunit
MSAKFSKGQHLNIKTAGKTDYTVGTPVVVEIVMEENKQYHVVNTDGYSKRWWWVYEHQLISADTIDITPTWSGILGTLIALIENSNEEGRTAAIEQLKLMAQAADNYNTNNEVILPLLNSVDAAFAVLFIGSDHGITPQALQACKAAAIDVQIALGHRNTDGTIKEG